MASSDSDDNPHFLLSTLHSDSDEDHKQEEENQDTSPTSTPTSPLNKVLDRHHQLQLHSIRASITIRELTSQGLSFQLWPAASSLVSLLDHNPSTILSDFQSKQTPIRILELGSGTGFVGVAAAAILGAHVTLTDLPNVLPNIRFNVDLNSEVVTSRGGSVSVQQLRWGNEEDAANVVALTQKFDLVVGSDVVYYEELIDPLLKTAEAFVKGETTFVVAHLKRWKKRDATFFKKARKNFIVEVLHKDPPLAEWRSGVAVYRFTAKKQEKVA